jgi:flagellar basal-body rod protein FlgB
MSQQIDLIGLLQSGIKAEEMRQKTIASNIANMETPGYRRLEVRFEDLLAKAVRSGSSTNPGDVEPEVFSPKNTFVKTNGNDVNLEMEIGEMLKNSSRQTALVRLLRKKFAQFEDAIGISG